MKYAVWIATNAVALAIAAWMLDGIRVEGNDWQEGVVPIVVAAFILGVVTVFVEPVVKLLSLPFIILTLGLFLIVINALMLMLTSWICDKTDVGFSVEGFWTAVVGAIIVTLVTGFIDLVAIEDD